MDSCGSAKPPEKRKAGTARPGATTPDLAHSSLPDQALRGRVASCSWMRRMLGLIEAAASSCCLYTMSATWEAIPADRIVSPTEMVRYVLNGSSAFDLLGEHP